MSLTIRGDMPLCDRLLCRGLLLSRDNNRMGAQSKDVFTRALTAFFELPEMKQYRLSDKRAITRAIEQTLTARVSFYTVQRRFDLPIERADRFGNLRRLYCACLIDQFGLYA